MEQSDYRQRFRRIKFGEFVIGSSHERERFPNDIELVRLAGPVSIETLFVGAINSCKIGLIRLNSLSDGRCRTAPTTRCSSKRSRAMADRSSGFIRKCRQRSTPVYRNNGNTGPAECSTIHNGLPESRWRSENAKQVGLLRSSG